MPYSELAKDQMLDAIAPTKVSLHTAEPNSSGSNEVSGGSYARQNIAWSAASAGVKDDTTNGAVFPVPAGTHVKFVGFWKGSEWMGFEKCTEEIFAGAGNYTLTDAKLTLNLIE